LHTWCCHPNPEYSHSSITCATPSVLNLKSVYEFSPSADGRHNVAHGVMAWVSEPSLTPIPPPRRERGVPQTRDGVRAVYPGLTPWAKLFRPYRGCKMRYHPGEEFLSGLPTQDTRVYSEV